MDADMNNSSQQADFFPAELEHLNKWIKHFQPAFLADDNNLGKTAYTVLQDASSFYAGCSIRAKARFMELIQGMWSESFEPFANTGDNAFLVLILTNIKHVVHLLKSYDNDFPAMEKISTNGKRINEIDNSLDDGFKKPLKTAKIVTLGTGTPVTTSNSFNTLNRNEDISDHDTTENTNTIPKEPRCEPFYVKTTQNWRDIANKIDELAECKVFKGVQGDFIKFFPKTIDVYRKIQKFLSDSNIEFFGMRPKNERPRKILIKGLPIDTPISEVKSELSSLGYDIHRVSQLRNFKTKLPLPIFLVDIFRNELFKNIFDVRSFLGFYIKVETYKFKGPKQCYNCQLYNHSSECCTLKPVCLKCSGGHRVNECKVTDRKDIKCANCGDNHTANFSGCPKNPRNIQSGRVTTIRDSNQRFAAITTTKNCSFADSLKGKKPDLTNIPKPTSSQNLVPGGNSQNISNTATNSKIITNVSNTGIKHKNPKTTAENVVNTVNSNIDNNNVLLNFVLSNFDNIDAIIEKLNKLYDIMAKFQKICTNKGMSELLSAINMDGQGGLKSSPTTK